MGYNKEQKIKDEVNRDIGNSYDRDFNEWDSKYDNLDWRGKETAKNEWENQREWNFENRHSGGGGDGGLLAILFMIFTKDGRKILNFLLGFCSWVGINILLHSNNLFPTFKTVFFVLGILICINFVVSAFSSSDKYPLISVKLMMTLCSFSNGLLIAYGLLYYKLYVLEKNVSDLEGILSLVIGMSITFFISKQFLLAKTMEEAFPSEEEKDRQKEMKKARRRAKREARRNK